MTDSNSNANACGQSIADYATAFRKTAVQVNRKQLGPSNTSWLLSEESILSLTTEFKPLNNDMQAELNTDPAVKRQESIATSSNFSKECGKARRNVGPIVLKQEHQPTFEHDSIMRTRIKTTVDPIQQQKSKDEQERRLKLWDEQARQAAFQRAQYLYPPSFRMRDEIEHVCGNQYNAFNPEN